MHSNLKLHIYHEMLKARILEERLIYMFKQNYGFFWIGGPGEEALNVPLGLQIKKGRGLNYDYFHPHYRSSAVLLAMGMDPIDPIRQMKNTALDKHTGGRNFVNFCSIPEWNVLPVRAPVETQYLVAIGTGIAQSTAGCEGITIVSGGDAGTAEGDFASCLIWSSRPNKELPILMIITNNGGGISTEAKTQHGEKNMADRATAFGIKINIIDGNDPEASYAALQEAMHYVRSQRKPFLLEAKVSRLYGHSSASGANYQNEEDPIQRFEAKLLHEKLITPVEIKKIREEYAQYCRSLFEQVLLEPQPPRHSIYDYTYWNQTGKYW